MTVHYHGTPLTPRSELDKMKGKNFCVSFANPGDADWCLSWAQEVMWDNGAYVFYQKATRDSVSVNTDWSKFYSWVSPRLGHPHWAVVPDVIDGTVEQNLALINEWPHRKDCAAVVWHLHEPIEHLIYLVELGFAKICFGSSGEFWQVGSVVWCQRVDEAFNSLQRTFGAIPWVHMLRGLAMLGDRWPFASADSTNVARNFKNIDSETCPERMARRIDSVQSPIIWTPRIIRSGKQVDIFA